jgi:hypothetical protein
MANLVVQPFAVHGQTVDMGPNTVNIGTPSYLHVLRNRNVVRLFCDVNGSKQMIDFQLGTPNNVKEFLRQMKEETEVFLMPICSVTQKLQDHGFNNGTFLGGAEFGFRSSATARNFRDYVAPLYFEGFQPNLQGRVVKLYTNVPRTEGEMDHALGVGYEALDPHTGHTLMAEVDHHGQPPENYVKVPPLMDQGTHMQVTFETVQNLGNKVFKPDINDLLERQQWRDVIAALAENPALYNDIAQADVDLMVSVVRVSTHPHSLDVYTRLLAKLPDDRFDNDELNLGTHLSYINLNQFLHGSITKPQLLERIVAFLNSKFADQVPKQTLVALRAELIQERTRVPDRINELIGGDPLQPAACCAIL